MLRFARNDGSLASNGIRHCEAIAEAIQRTKSIIPYKINNAEKISVFDTVIIPKCPLGYN
ncbi:MAG: hypothetical protein LBC89_03010 [Bacteroidales bacterium]|nr:hypothetical protein [Bacteroidales bacterium]